MLPPLVTPDELHAVADLTAKELKVRLRKRKLDCDGRKAQLAARLQWAMTHGVNDPDSHNAVRAWYFKVDTDKFDEEEGEYDG